MWREGEGGRKVKGVKKKGGREEKGSKNETNKPTK